ncbi:MAG: MmgE/PrpD family protein [Marinomonas sp.]
MEQINQFIHTLRFEDLSQPLIKQASDCFIDLLGVAAAGHDTKLAKIMEAFVSDQMAGSVPLLFSDKSASVSGASLFGASLIDSIDAHDGQVLTKGHVGVAILPPLLALISDSIEKGQTLDGKELITCLVIGYEVATRAGIALHATALDYHTSGAWNSIGVAAVSARLLKLDQNQTREALGIAEFHGPRSQMMRCIDYPTMVKDGSGWGALAGVTSSLLAKANFTGAPAITLDADTLSNSPEQAHAVAEIWQDLGRRWYIEEQYFKAYPVCRWAQPAVEAVRAIQAEAPLDHTQVESIEIVSFHQAKRLHVTNPSTTEQAQYSLPFSVASAIMDNEVSPESISETGLGLFNPERIALSEKVQISESDDYNAVFPAERWAHAIITLKNGERLTSPGSIAKGNPENPLTEQEIKEKFFRLSSTRLSSDQQSLIFSMCDNMAALDSQEIRQFMGLLKAG